MDEQTDGQKDELPEVAAEETSAGVNCRAAHEDVTKLYFLIISLKYL